MFATLTRVFRERNDYRCTRSWLINLYSRLLRRFPSLPLPGRSKIVAIHCSGFDRPVLIRLGTSDILVVHELFVRHEYDFVARRLHHINTILDLGANIGLSMAYWREKYPEALIVGVEPDHANAVLCHLNRRVVRHHHARSHVIRACAGATRRHAFLDRSDEAYSFRMAAEIADASDPDAVPVLTIHDILSLAHMPPSIDLLKCDIEGAEAELFSHCADWIDKVGNMVIEIHPPYTLARLMMSLASGRASFELLENIPKGNGLSLAFLRRKETNTVTLAGKAESSS